MAFWTIMGIIAVLLLIIVPIHYYNRGITLRNRCTESYANVETELRRRYELIPNLVASVKGYMSHEQGLIAEVTSLRVAAMASRGGAARQAARERPLVGAVDRLLAVAEAYPELRAIEAFMQLQNELAVTEDRIQAARRFYNGNVRDYRNHTHQFPGNVFARIYSFEAIDFFEVDPIVHAAPKVQV